jgi:hypothetical protein
VRTGSELLGIDRDRLVPLSATVVARPARLCVLVPLYVDVPWQVSVEHALACQARYWGGHASFVVPMYDGVEDDEVFWRLVRQYDPDMIGLHAPTLEDMEEMAPPLHERAIERLRASLSQDHFAKGQTDDYIIQAQNELFWDVEVPDGLARDLIKWVAPFHHDEHLRSILVNGAGAVPHDLTDVLRLGSLPARVENVRAATGFVDQLLVTGSIGRLTGATIRAAAERGVTVEEHEAQSLAGVTGFLWPRGRSACPSALPEAGLARRMAIGRPKAPILVVGDEPRDWLLYHGLSRLRPLVYWLPESRLAEGDFVQPLRHELSLAAQSTGRLTAIAVTATSTEAATRAVDETAAAQIGGNILQLDLEDWQDHIPHGPFWAADAPSVRTVSLLRSAGTTEELPTPTPAGVSPEDLIAGGWLVDVDVREWSTFRHAALGSSILLGGFSSSYDQRIGAGGACFFGLSGFIQTGLGLANALARHQLAPLPVLGAVSDALALEGWSVTLSDKGAFAQRSAQLFGGVEQLVQSLRDEGTRMLLDTYMADKRAGVPGCFLSDTRRRYLSLKEACDAIAAPADDIVNNLYDRGALIRGHVLKCEQCRATSFYSLTEAQQFICCRCRHDQRATRASWLGEPEPVFRYELAEVVYQLLTHDGSLPLLAAYDYFVATLGPTDRRALDLGFEIEVVSPDGKKSEHDIVAVWGSDLWLGEATNAANLGSGEVARIRRLRNVAELLAARGVLFATTGEFGTRTRERVNSVFSSWPRPEVVFLERLAA